MTFRKFIRKIFSWFKPGRKFSLRIFSGGLFVFWIPILGSQGIYSNPGNLLENFLRAVCRDPAGPLSKISETPGIPDFPGKFRIIPGNPREFPGFSGKSREVSGFSRKYPENPRGIPGIPGEFRGIPGIFSGPAYQRAGAQEIFSENLCFPCVFSPEIF